MHMNLDRLRSDLPGFTWTAQRDGFSWVYIGNSQDREVLVKSFSQCCWDDDDHDRKEWRVLEDGQECCYAAFYLQYGRG